jgi:hypothetical protein
LKICAQSCFGGFFSKVLVHFFKKTIINNKTKNFLRFFLVFSFLAWHKITKKLLFFKKIVILGFYAGKSHNLIGQGIFHGDQKS